MFVALSDDRTLHNRENSRDRPLEIYAARLPHTTRKWPAGSVMLLLVRSPHLSLHYGDFRLVGPPAHPNITHPEVRVGRAATHWWLLVYILAYLRCPVIKIFTTGIDIGTPGPSVSAVPLHPWDCERQLMQSDSGSLNLSSPCV